MKLSCLSKRICSGICTVNDTSSYGTVSLHVKHRFVECLLGRGLMPRERNAPQPSFSQVGEASPHDLNIWPRAIKSSAYNPSREDSSSVETIALSDKNVLLLLFNVYGVAVSTDEDSSLSVLKSFLHNVVFDVSRLERNSNNSERKPGRSVTSRKFRINWK